MALAEKFLALRERLLGACGFEISNLVLDHESGDYGACRFELGGRTVLYRQSKVTPTKAGQFVTAWKRKTPRSPISPFDSSDAVTLLMVAIEAERNLGLFIFPVSALIEHDIFSVRSKGGKRAFRLYPPWDRTVSKQSMQSQAWQSAFFLDLTNTIEGIGIKVRAKALLLN
jgi:hypothetical protein